MWHRWSKVYSCVVELILLKALRGAFGQRPAAQTGTIPGTVLDINAKPWADVGVQAVSDQGVKQDAKTDKDGKYSIGGLRPGVYGVTIVTFPPPNDKQPPYQLAKVRVGGSEEAKGEAK